jgi:hypothetical protein
MWQTVGEALMPRKTGYWLALGVLVGCVVGAAWPGAPGDPATLISRVGALVIAVLIVVLHWPVRRRYGPLGSSWTARIVRIVGFGLMAALILVKAAVERQEFAHLAGRPALTGVWAGEIAFLIVIAAYVTGLLAITARRPPSSPAATLIGTVAGVLLGVAVYVLRPLDNPVHTSSAWLSTVVEIARVSAVPFVFAVATAAVVMAARRTSRRDRDGTLSLTHVRARQGVAAGLCVGVTCALLVSVLGITTIAIAPHAASSIQWTIPGSNQPASSLYAFEVNASHAVAGYLLILIIFPFLGAGVGAWGGLFAAGNRGLRPGGGGGGGTRPPRPKTPPPNGGRQLDGAPAFTAANLLNLPEWDPVTEGPRSASPERVPANLRGRREISAAGR